MSLATSSASQINTLQSSAAFAMSLGAKELFHTNFLAFLLESEDPALDPMRLAIRQALNIRPTSGAVSHCAVWREKNNFDLIVVELQPATTAPVGSGEPAEEERSNGVHEGTVHEWDWNEDGGWHERPEVPHEPLLGPAGPTRIALTPTGRVLVVEAKLKSVPRLQQLDEYDARLAASPILLRVPEWSIRIGGKHGTVERRLLSIPGAGMTTPSGGVWQGVSWAQLQSVMAGVLPPIQHALHQTLYDYVSALGALVVLANRAVTLCNQARRTAGVPYEAMLRQPLDSQFRDMRIADLLGKTLFDCWLNALAPSLRSACASAPAPWRLQDYVHYTRGTPGFGVEFINDNYQVDGQTLPLRIGVQLQGAELRLYVAVEGTCRGLEQWVAGHPLLLSRWFCLSVLTRPACGRKGATPQQTKGPPRWTNLKIFDVQRFLYSGVIVLKDPVPNVEQEVGRLMGVACRLLTSI